MEEIARRRPIDATAARVTAAGPKGYESSKRIAQVCSEAPLPMRPVPRDMPDMTGATFGLFTVVGLSRLKSSDGALWLCRCVCGYYVTRKTKAVRNPTNAKDRCDRCRQVAFLRRSSEFRDLGYNPNESESR